ncbi:MAG: hypothetical protein WKG00_24160 [Polyangiaceae bacterium]
MSRAITASLFIFWAALELGCTTILGVDDYVVQDPGPDAGADAGPAAGCQDGLQNGEELGIDCGGPCPPCEEDCANGTDDNGDGAVDCEDTICAQHQCIPEAPAGWDGPFAVAVGAMADVACPGGWPAPKPVAHMELQVPAPACTDCTCTVATPISCGLTPLVFYVDESCSLTGAAENVVAGSCVGSAHATALSVSVGPPATVAGTCAFDGGDRVVATWAQHVTTCAGGLGAGCAAGSVCAPPIAMPFGTGACISGEGNMPCPDAYPVPTTAFRDVADTRTCTACTCGQLLPGPSGGGCAATVALYADLGCTGGFVPTGVNGCTQVSDGVESLEVIDLQVPATPPGGCSGLASGGDPEGQVEPSEPLTICCLR